MIRVRVSMTLNRNGNFKINDRKNAFAELKKRFHDWTKPPYRNTLPYRRMGHLFEDFAGAAGALERLAPVGVLIEGRRLGYRLTGRKTDYL